MAIQINQLVRVLFKVVDFAALPVTGLVAGNFTLTLTSGSPGSFTAAVETVTVVEEGAGLYWAMFTPTEQAQEYYLEIVHATYVVAPDTFQVTIVGPSPIVGPYFTSLALVKERLFPGVVAPTTNYDGMINSIIAEVTDRIRQKLDSRFLFERTTVEYVDGSGTLDLFLREGPLISVSSVYTVEYGDDGFGARTETLTLVDESEYVLEGLRANDYIGVGWISRLGSYWLRGQRNYKITYDAGFSALPAGVQSAATRLVLAEINRRPGLDLVWLGDYRIEQTDEKKLDDAINATLAPLTNWNIS